MRAHDLRDRFLKVVMTHTDWVNNAEVHYPQWCSIKRAVYAILGEAGDQAKCRHPELFDGVICAQCGRRPHPENTLPEESHERSPRV